MSKILISRTDSLGDVILTLPMAGVIKKFRPETKIAFLGTSYTQPLIEKSAYVDEFYDWHETGLESIRADTIIHVFPQRKIAMSAKKAKTGLRIGTSHRLYHWWTCNRLVNLGRKNSSLHEAQLNLKLLKPLGMEQDFPLEALHMFYGWEEGPLENEKIASILNKKKFTLIFHMKSKGSAMEWPLHCYLELAEQLPEETFQILATGTSEEGKEIADVCPKIFQLDHVEDITGRLTVKELVLLIQHADGLLGCSTGPLHIAAAAGIFALGLYPSERPMHAGRWGPIGKKAHFIEAPISGRRGKSTLEDISASNVKETVLSCLGL
jgi:ADP-heptose:LPS heptosyltransferase